MTTAYRIHPAILAGDGPCTCTHGQWHHHAGARSCRRCPCRAYHQPETPTPPPARPPLHPSTSAQLADALARVANLEQALAAALRHPPAKPADWARISRERDQAVSRAERLAAEVDHLRGLLRTTARPTTAA